MVTVTGSDGDRLLTRLCVLRQAFVVFVQLMNQHGILKTDDLITRFFRMATQMCVDLCYR